VNLTRRIALLALVLTMALGLPSPSRAEEERPADRVLILYTGETHGNVEPCG
jgi:hypothetical protein